ncbi:hypothetical protein HII36_14950 [Nonomuraea sp. NN258]|uniref:FUSC family protein n=1 Tax=Nonomuraea antri TaxID=2730852 RepID=UPI001568932E|nr:aromatic acid exporter family protein [Nonomuraea antri]NRQ33131.1 hypothetical protein [Nonomuraea antri]
METESGRRRKDLARSPIERVVAGGAAALARLRKLGFGDWLRTERDEFVQTVKVTVACMLAWWLAASVLELDLPVLVPIGVLLTVSATAYSTIIRGMQQVGAVIAGVAAATLLIWLLGVNTLTLGVLVTAGLVLSRLLNMPAQNVQIPITALLVLSLGRNYGLARLADVLLGAGIGIVANLLILPPRFVEKAAKELCDLADEMSDLADDMADGLDADWDEDVARDWLDRARGLAQRLEDTENAAEQAAESIRLSLRRHRYKRRLEQVAEAAACLDHACTQFRGIARALTDLMAGVRGLPERPPELPGSLADALRALSRIFHRFGLLLLGRGNTKDLRALNAARRECARHQRTLTGDFEATVRQDADLWPLYGAIVEDCARITHEFDPEHGPHRAAFPPYRRS